MDKKKKGKQIKLIISLISVGIFAYSYFVIYNEYIIKTSEAYNEVELYKKKMLEREEMLAQEEEIQISLEEVNQKKQDIMNSYPVYIAKEDNFMFIKEMQDNLKIDLSSINVSDNTSFYKTIIPAIANEEDNEDSISSKEDANMTAELNTISLNFLTSYKGFKELSEYIRDYPEPTVIDNVSVSYDSSTGALAGSLTLKRFALTGTGKEYKVKPIDNIEIGTDNIFGTGGTN